MTERQREKVVKYINELAEDFELCVQTGGLACNYFDRYMSHVVRAAKRSPSKRPNIQVIASTCLLIASKFFDRKLPPLSELEKVHLGSARPDEFADTELSILAALNWKLHMPLPHVFVEHLKKLCDGAPFNSAIDDRMLFFIDLSVYGYQFLAYSPCVIAASSMVAAWKFSEEAPGVVEEHFPMLARACELDPQQLWDCVASLVRYYQVCFPDAAKGSHAALFMPIHDDSTNTTQTSRTVSPAESSSSTESALTSEEGGAAEAPPPSSSSSALYVRVGPDSPEEPPSLCQQGGTPSPAHCPSPSAGEMAAATAAAEGAAASKAPPAGAKVQEGQLPEQLSGDRADTPSSVMAISGV